MALQPLRLVGVLADDIWVMRPRPRDEHVHQFLGVYNTNIRGHKTRNYWPRCKATGVAMAITLYSNSRGLAQVLPPPPNNEVDTNTIMHSGYGTF